MRENPDLAIPISGDPYLSEFRVLGFFELTVEVGFVRGVSGSDYEIGFSGGGEGKWEKV